MDDSQEALRIPSIMEKQTQLHLHVERPLYEQNVLNEIYNYEKPRATITSKFKKTMTPNNFKTYAANTIPVVRWLKNYNWKEDIMSDIISGITVAIMHIPQGMAYAMLGNVPPVVGIYMAFFPVLIYFFLGTSKHVSMGTFAVACLMTGKVVTALSNADSTLSNKNLTTLSNENQSLNSQGGYTNIQVATSVTFMVGLIQLLMYVFRLGVISTLLSETFVNGFTTGAAIQVLISQFADLFGVKLPKRTGYFQAVHTLIDLFIRLPTMNFAALTISSVSIIIMVFNNELLKPRVSKLCNFPIPIELIAVISGTLISTYCNLSSVYEIRTVGHIPTGLPNPEIPSFELLSTVALDSIAVTMVSYTVTMSMSLIFAQKLQYDVDSNQELFAMGAGNIFGSFFSCMPVSASLSRSLIQQTVGGKTQLASVVSCFLLLCILLWIGPFFEPLPRCVLASIIVVALKGMLLQAKALTKFWKLNKIDGIIWIVTVLSVVLIDLDIGLLVGLLMSLASVLLQSVKSYTCVLGNVPNTDLYLDQNRYQGTKEISGIKIIHYAGNLNFVTERQFRSEIQQAIGIVPRKILKRRIKLSKRGLYLTDDDCDSLDVQFIIIDMSALTYIDPTGVKTLRDIVDEYCQIEIPVYLAACTVSVFDNIQKCDIYEKGKPSFRIFATIHDAVFYSQQEHSQRPLP
ncbi:solute carrier family 26 member 6-like [Leptopilina boulardi]|uniref:solute carrier family 26 member 6-like n=1 Tax=Leptopilina boulardi TaxID=63433 RepID=UPI0021F5F0CE|nr:solute carrier family 26 member 6-like [Leptopilina boulardi]XP_051174060.1 solute carrier family 26 member 6-like [Leptopilina boulardi]